MLLTPLSTTDEFGYGHSAGGRRKARRQHYAEGDPGRYRARGRPRLTARGIPGARRRAHRGKQSVEVVVPDSTDSPARGVLQELGFHERQDRLRMELGDPLAPAGIEQYGTTPYLAT